MKKYIKDMNVEEVTKLLSEGAILQATNGTYEVINGLFVYKQGEFWDISPRICSATQDCFFEMPEPEIEIKVGEFYKTRNGLKAYVYSPAAENRFAVVVEGKAPYTVSANGYVSDEAEDELDLVALYNDSKEEIIVNMLKTGKKRIEVAAELKMTPSAISRIATKNNLRKNKQRCLKYDYDEIKDLLLKGFSYAEIAKKIGMAYSTTANFILKNKELYELYKIGKDKTDD